MPTLDSPNIPIRYIDAAAAAEATERWGRISPLALTDRRIADTDVVVYDLGEIAAGNDLYSQVPTWRRANYRALTRDYPETFTDIDYSNVAHLAITADRLTEELASLLGRLANDYPVYDEEAMSELENEEISESVSDYVIHDIAREMDGQTREAWDDLTRDEQIAMVFNVCQSIDYYPEHSGLEVLWRYEELAPAITARLAPVEDTGTLPGKPSGLDSELRRFLP